MYVIIGIVFTLRGQGRLGVYDGGGGQEEEEEKKIQFRRSDADLWAYVFIALNLNQRRCYPPLHPCPGDTWQ